LALLALWAHSHNKNSWIRMAHNSFNLNGKCPRRIFAPRCSWLLSCWSRTLQRDPRPVFR
jgi:hypothetical protein